MSETVGSRIAQARYRKGWSRRQVIDAIKASGRSLTETTLRNIEKGYSEPFPQTVYILADALEVEPEDLFIEVPA